MRRQKTNFKLIMILVLLAAIFGIGYKLYNSAMFEKNPPTISLEDSIFWNGKDPIEFTVSDDSGIKSIKIYLENDQERRKISDITPNIATKSQTLSLELPKEIFLLKSTGNRLLFEITDVSKWNFTMGNTLNKEINVIVDNKKPEISVINQSYKITKGGSAIVIFKAADDNLKEVYIDTNYGKRFIATPFFKDGYYAALLAWSVTSPNFEAHIIAKDSANNESKVKIPFFLQEKNYKESTITLKDDFIDGKISELYEIYGQDESASGIEKFKFINENLRHSNEEIIAEITSQVHESLISDFKIASFYPLPKGAAVASYGDHRFYERDGAKISESWHLGLDLASTAQAEIISSNTSRVAAVKENGIYGLMVILDHGFGLYSIYGHCSSSNLNENDTIASKSVVAYTGKSGLAFGDHLHFGVLVQGVEVRPEEWMDEKWMQDNIYEVIENAKNVIQNGKN